MRDASFNNRVMCELDPSSKVPFSDISCSDDPNGYLFLFMQELKMAPVTDTILGKALLLAFAPECRVIYCSNKTWLGLYINLHCTYHAWY